MAREKSTGQAPPDRAVILNELDSRLLGILKQFQDQGVDYELLKAGAERFLGEYTAEEHEPDGMPFRGKLLPHYWRERWPALGDDAVNSPWFAYLMDEAAANGDDTIVWPHLHAVFEAMARLVLGNQTSVSRRKNAEHAKDALQHHLELRGGVDATREGRDEYPDPDNYDRNVWLYNERKKARKWDDILDDLQGNDKGWSFLATHEAARNAIDGIADYHDWERLRFQGGRPSKKVRSLKPRKKLGRS